MTSTAAPAYRLGEFHPFVVAERNFVYLPAGAMFELDEAAIRLIRRLENGEVSHPTLIGELVASGYERADAEALIGELRYARVLLTGDAPAPPMASLPADYPLQALVMNLTNQCNLACTYCYEFGADKIATPHG